MEDLQKKFTKDLVNYTINNLSGETPEYDFLEDFRKPENEIIIGTLAYEDREGLLKSTTKIKTNTISIRFLTASTDEIAINSSFAFYFFSYPTFEEVKSQIIRNYDKGIFEKEDDLESKFKEILETITEEKIRLKKGWRKIRVEIPQIVLPLEDSISTPLDLKQYIETIKKHPLATGQGDFKDRNEFSIDIEDLLEEEVYLCFVSRNKAKLPEFNWNVSINLTKDKYPQDEDVSQITVTLANNTEENKKYDNTLFNSKLSIQLRTVNIIDYVFPYDYEGFKRSYSTRVQSINCEAIFNPEKKEIITQFNSCFEQPIIIPKTDITSFSGETFALKFLDLINRDTNLILLDRIVESMKTYSDFYKKDGRIGTCKRFETLSRKFERQIERIEEGITILKTNQKARTAFELMNQSFYECNKGKYDRWRVFQLCFILQIIPDIVNSQKTRDIAEVLHVQTGGGKSETYFGCVIFTAFWDRLNGKEFGVTAITKFPLRMLSIQQLQRIAEIMIFAERIRKQNDIPGHEFTVGFFVGKSEDYPDKNFHLIRNIIAIEKKGKSMLGKMIQKCPFCIEAEVNLVVDESKRIVYHQCSECNERFGLFFTSEEVYRTLPTFMVSTVDKHAGVALNRRYKNLIGGKLDLCSEHGFYPRNDKCTCPVPLEKGNKSKDCGNRRGEKVEISFSTAPTLAIQDEMHLIKESFGTIDSHFETLIETMIEEFTGNKVKNITMTATITGADHQIKELYNKDTHVFPTTSPFERGTNDFFFNLEKVDSEPKTERLIVGLRPNFRDNQYACLITLRHILNFIDKAERNKQVLIEEYNSNEPQFNSLLELYKSALTYHGKKADVHSMKYLLHDVVNAEFEGEDKRIVGYTLTGDNSLDQIKDHIYLVENNDNCDKSEILATFATSVVSHGVDINNWNVMLFQGIPRSTAEYIQALSRIGRKNIGVVFVWFYGTRVRDISFYQNFRNYHDILEHHIDPIPISRWAQLGFYQSFHSLFCASILNYFSNYLERPIFHVPHVVEVFSDEDNVQKLVDFIRKAYQLQEDNSERFLEKFIPKEIEQRLKFLKNYGTGLYENYFPFALEEEDDPYYKTQYGMRGIQNQVAIQPVYRERNFVSSFVKSGDSYE